MAAITPTPDQLQTAWLQVRKSDWEPTLDEVLQHPIHGRLVTLRAKLIALGRQIGEQLPVQLPAVARPEPPTRHVMWRRRSLPPAAPGVDLKRAAAGERDDD